MSILEMTLHEVSQKLKNKEVSSVELTKASIERIKETEPKIDAFLTITEENALNEAKLADEKFNKGEIISPLMGIPMAIKDNICTDGVKTTCASKMLENFVPPYDATVIGKLKNAGAVMMGKTNMDEFAMGGSNENSAFKLTRNPWDLERVPGGSSGGSAAAVSSSQVFYSLGSDTGGSVRQPAAFNGLVGIKPTYGRISRYGLVAFGSSLDQIGIFAKDSLDCALVMQEIAGQDNMDSTSSRQEVPNYAGMMNSSVKGLKIGVPKEFFGEGIDEGVSKAVMDALKVYESLGATWEFTSLPHTDYAIATYYVLAPCEASSNLARFDGIRYGFRAGEFETLEELYVKTRSQGFGEEVKRRIVIGTYALSAGYYDAYYKKALQVRTLIKNEYVEAFKKYDILITPTAPGKAFKIGEKINDPLAMYMEDKCTLPINIAGVPAVSIPCGIVDNMPVGMQIIGNYFAEGTILNAARAYENVTDFNKKRAVL